MATPKIGERLYSYGKHRTDFYGLAVRLKTRTDWYMGAMWAEEAMGPRTYGILPPEYRDSVNNADYIVYSWQTPIAWHDKDTGEWTQPDVKYSKTTTVQQGKIAVALSVMDKV
jgi:ABC-type amino acid transport substrate-binding protein